MMSFQRMMHEKQLDIERVIISNLLHSCIKFKNILFFKKKQNILY